MNKLLKLPLFLGICGGFQILGEYIQTENSKINGINLLNLHLGG